MAQRWIKSSRNLCSVLDTLGHAAGSREKAWAIHDFTPQTGQFEVAVMKGNADEVPEFKLLKAEGSGCDKPKDKKPAEKDNKPVEKPAEYGTSKLRSKSYDAVICGEPKEKLHK